jgi:hypothetical protein
MEVKKHKKNSNITLHMKNENIVSSVEDITMSILVYAENKGVEIIFDTDIEEKIIAFDLEKIERINLELSDIYTTIN